MLRKCCYWILNSDTYFIFSALLFFGEISFKNTVGPFFYSCNNLTPKFGSLRFWQTNFRWKCLVEVLAQTHMKNIITSLRSFPRDTFSSIFHFSVFHYIFMQNVLLELHAHVSHTCVNHVFCDLSFGELCCNLEILHFSTTAFS